MEPLSMNESANVRTLIIGIGNPLRSDDGLGWAVAKQLAQDDDASYNIRMVHQLTPELAQEIASANLVIMVDASYEGKPGELHIRSLSSSAQPGAVGAHHTTPEELAVLTTAVYDRCPLVVVVTMTGADFGIGELLSPVVVRKLPLISSAVRQICANGPQLTGYLTE